MSTPNQPGTFSRKHSEHDQGSFDTVGATSIHIPAVATIRHVDNQTER
jgi:hypothetical protein